MTDAILTDERCGNCRFARPQADSPGFVNCRRFPPSIVPGMQMTPQGPVPTVNKVIATMSINEWCGEYRHV